MPAGQESFQFLFRQHHMERVAYRLGPVNCLIRFLSESIGLSINYVPILVAFIDKARVPLIGTRTLSTTPSRMIQFNLEFQSRYGFPDDRYFAENRAIRPIRGGCILNVRNS